LTLASGGPAGRQRSRTDSSSLQAGTESSIRRGLIRALAYPRGAGASALVKRNHSPSTRLPAIQPDSSCREFFEGVPVECARAQALFLICESVGSQGVLLALRVTAPLTLPGLRFGSAPDRLRFESVMSGRQGRTGVAIRP
jgi:hypothetical protein